MAQSTRAESVKTSLLKRACAALLVAASTAVVFLIVDARSGVHGGPRQTSRPARAAPDLASRRPNSPEAAQAEPVPQAELDAARERHDQAIQRVRQESTGRLATIRSAAEAGGFDWGDADPYELLTRYEEEFRAASADPKAGSTFSGERPVKGASPRLRATLQVSQQSTQAMKKVLEEWRRQWNEELKAEELKAKEDDPKEEPTALARSILESLLAEKQITQQEFESLKKGLDDDRRAAPGGDQGNPRKEDVPAGEPENEEGSDDER